MKRMIQGAGRLCDWVKRLAFREETAIQPNQITIGITTFEARFEQYFSPLLLQIRKYVDSEVIVAINGEHDQLFGEGYRRKILGSLAVTENTYPIMFPRFRGLSKLWNSIIIHATNDYVLMLNDDIMITRPDFVERICGVLRYNKGKTFIINNSWSHFVISREEIDELGYFDERLLGIGEEDGDMTWRYMNRYGQGIASFKIKGFNNFAEDTVRSYKPVNIRTHSGTKYSLFNRKFMFEQKYEAVSEGIQGMFENPVAQREPNKDQYPNERFYRLRKGEL